MFAAQLENCISKTPGRSLDHIAQQVWKALTADLISEQAAERLAGAIDARRVALKRKRLVSQGKGSQSAPRAITSPDKARSLARRRKQAASGALSPDIASHFTTAEQAALAVIAHRIKRSGSCDWFMDKIAAIAGICRTSARNAIRKAQELGLIEVQERRVRWFRNLSNVIDIVSRDWRQWLNLKGGGCKKVKGTNTNNNIPAESTSLFTVCSRQALLKPVYFGHEKHRNQFQAKNHP
jgi:hypothetical protein